MYKSRRFGLVLTSAEKHALNRLAEIEGGLSQAATLRRLIRQAAAERGLWPLTDDRSNQHHKESQG